MHQTSASMNSLFGRKNKITIGMKTRIFEKTVDKEIWGLLK
jgi:hypothetical protein